MISIKDIEKLAELSRIKISEAEKESFLKDIESILGYVDQIKNATGGEALPEPAVESGLRNIFREDSNPHSSGLFTEELLDSAPETENGYIKVKKII